MTMERFKLSHIWQLILPVIMKCWALSGAAVFTFLLVYWAYGGFLALSLLGFAITGIFYHMQDALLYHPGDTFQNRLFVHTPTLLSLPYENIFIRSIDGTLIHMYFIRQPEDKASHVPTIVFLHGNAGNVGHRLRNASGLYHNLHCNILMLEYRGYGLSKGSPSEQGLCMDARAAIDFLSTRSDVNHKMVVVFGRSLGGAVAIDLVARPEYSARIWCVVLENTFTSIPDMAYTLIHSKFIKHLPLWIFKNKFMSKRKVPHVQIPVLFISGQADTLVPPAMMRELHKLCPSPHKQLVSVEAGTHNDTWACPGYYASIATFLTSVHAMQPNPPRPPSCVLAV
ncbi:protein ABHD13 [Macrosteles quadrilineatus]|uniref:protein ABHD13 n=1 Tax=Macrosteles quadrilineatus TaxID=74068 RepID=UPI0023E16227|nr:protein ABHD13 [Macrosteles quadrilineatus]